MFDKLVANAVDGVDLTVHAGETLAIVDYVDQDGHAHDNLILDKMIANPGQCRRVEPCLPQRLRARQSLAEQRIGVRLANRLLLATLDAIEFVRELTTGALTWGSAVSVVYLLAMGLAGLAQCST